MARPGRLAPYPWLEPSMAALPNAEHIKLRDGSKDSSLKRGKGKIVACSFAQQSPTWGDLDMVESRATRSTSSHLVLTWTLDLTRPARTEVVILAA